MAEVKFTNISPGDLPRTLRDPDIVFSDLGISVLKTKIARFDELAKDSPVDTSYLGTPVYDTIVFGDTENQNRNNYYNLSGELVTITPMVLHDAVLDVSQTKRIISTPIQGRNGEVKEYISDGDYVINLTGNISGIYDFNKNTWISPSRFFPKGEVFNMVDICRAGASIPISSTFLREIFRVTQVIISDYKFTQRRGYRNQQYFEINMMSDADVILEYTEEDVNDSDKLQTILNA